VALASPLRLVQHQIPRTPYGYRTAIEAVSGLHFTANLPSVTYHSKLYDFPAFPDLVPELDGWLDEDPFGANPADKLAVLKDSTDWCTNIGHPGPASPAIGEVLYTFVIPNMFAKAARGELSPQQSVAEAEKQINSIFQNWRSRGLVAG
jgi:hypothetical protein